MKNVQLLADLLNADQLSKLEKAAERHLQQSNVSFEVLEVTDQEIHVQTSQAETASGKYATEQTLVKRTQDLFSKLLPDYSIAVEVQTFLPSPASIVNTAWIERKMEERGIRIKQIAFDTGIDRESISAWVTGKRAMSQIVKAMFYFYLSK